MSLLESNPESTLFSLHVGGDNRSGQLPDKILDEFCSNLKAAGASIASVSRHAGHYNDHAEESAVISVEETTPFGPIFECIQTFRRSWDQMAIGMSNQQQAYLRITEGTIYCAGLTTILRRDTLRPRAGVDFDISREGFVPHGNVLICSLDPQDMDGMAERFQTFMPQRLTAIFSHFELFRLPPVERELVPPLWLPTVMGLTSNEFLVWVEAPADGVPALGKKRD